MMINICLGGRMGAFFPNVFRSVWVQNQAEIVRRETFGNHPKCMRSTRVHDHC